MLIITTELLNNFDSLPYGLTLAKLQCYGRHQSATNLLTTLYSNFNMYSIPGLFMYTCGRSMLQLPESRQRSQFETRWSHFEQYIHFILNSAKLSLTKLKFYNL